MSDTILERRVCEGCGWKGNTNSMLTAANPFDDTELVVGCPQCKSVNRLRSTCDEPGCWAEDTIGTPTPVGYRRTCYKHTLLSDLERKND